MRGEGQTTINETTPALDQLTTSPLPLDQRIALVLSDGADLNSAALADLLDEVAEAYHAAVATAATAKAKSLNPANPDPAPARAELDAAQWMIERLGAVYPRLATTLDHLRDREYADDWADEYHAVKVRRDEVALRLAETYQGCGLELRGLFSEIAIVDQQCNSSTAPLRPVIQIDYSQPKLHCVAPKRFRS